MDTHRRLRRSPTLARATTLALVLSALTIAAFISSCSPRQTRERIVGGPVNARTIPATAPLPGLTAPPSQPPLLSPTPSSSPTPLPPAPTATSSPTSTETAPAPTISPTASVTDTPQTPRVISDGAVNLRAGPGRSYPVVATLHAGQVAAIVGRNAAGDWWQLAGIGGKRVWVADSVVRVIGPVDKVAVARDIPTAAPVPTAALRATAPPVAARAQSTKTPIPSGPDFKLASVRLWGAVENGGSFNGPLFNCGLGRVLHVYVIDSAGNPLNGVTVKSGTLPYEEEVTGLKGPGMAEFVLGEAKEVYVLRDAAGKEVTSDRSRGVSTMVYDIPVELLIHGGYCRDAQDCANYIAPCSCCHHYSWDVTFQRAD
jgi:uncharacterized protein YraI